MSEYTLFDSFFHGNISTITEDNIYFRRVLATTPNMQLVIMSLKPGESIGSEVHPYITQFFRIEQGEGLAIIENNIIKLTDGSAIIVPLNTKHNIINTSKTTSLKLYTIYSPPNHPHNRIDIIKPLQD